MPFEGQSKLGPVENGAYQDINRLGRPLLEDSSTEKTNNNRVPLHSDEKENCMARSLSDAIA
jgi:hypothetical protein